MESRSYWLFGLKSSVLFWRRRIILFVVNFLAGHPAFKPINDLRRYLLSLIGANIGTDSQLSEAIYIHNGSRLTIGKGLRLGSHCRIYDFSEISIGEGLLASHGLTLISGTHDTYDLTDKPGPIFIGNNVWIGINVTIVGPVSIGNNAILGAGSLVIKDIPADTIAAGVPAKPIRSRSSIGVGSPSQN